jgi:hypothetical protein
MIHDNSLTSQRMKSKVNICGSHTFALSYFEMLTKSDFVHKHFIYFAGYFHFQF